jgi:hypothetical protein
MSWLTCGFARSWRDPGDKIRTWLVDGVLGRRRASLAITERLSRSAMADDGLPDRVIVTARPGRSMSSAEMRDGDGGSSRS